LLQAIYCSAAHFFMLIIMVLKTVSAWWKYCCNSVGPTCCGASARLRQRVPVDAPGSMILLLNLSPEAAQSSGAPCCGKMEMRSARPRYRTLCSSATARGDRHIGSSRARAPALLSPMPRALPAALVAVACVIFARTACAQEQDARALAAGCASCHQPTERMPPPLAGQSSSELLEKLRAFRDGTRSGTVMPQLARGYTPAQLEAVARYFAAQAPAQ
jgi:cytochrome subunit of sulfide dehydrogenase